MFSITVNMNDGSEINDKEYKGSIEQAFADAKHYHPNWSSMVIVVSRDDMKMRASLTVIK